MNKQEREALMTKLQLDNDAMAIDMAMRKKAREDAGDYDDPVVIKQARSSNFDPADAIADQEFRQRNYKARAKPRKQTRDDELITMRVLHQALGLVADETFALLGSDFKKIRQEIATLRNTVATLECELARTSAL